MAKKKNKQYRKCADCIHEWDCQTWAHGTIHNTDATSCAVYETVKDSNAYYLGFKAGQELSNKTIELMAEYIVAVGRVDYFLCDTIPKEIHLKYQPKNDGNYENEPCQKCMVEYFKVKAGEQE